jgi:hypothetical protein
MPEEPIQSSFRPSYNLFLCCLAAKRRSEGVSAAGSAQFMVRRRSLLERAGQLTLQLVTLETAGSCEKRPIN